MIDNKKITLDDLWDIEKEIVKSDELIDKLNKENEVLTSKRSKYLYNYILDNDLFKDTSWLIKSGGLTLVYKSSKNKSGYDFLKEMFGIGYADFSTEGVELYYSDGTITANFDDHTLIPEFARKFKIEVDGSEVVGRLRKINHDVERLIELCHYFNLKG